MSEHDSASDPNQVPAGDGSSSSRDAKSQEAAGRPRGKWRRRVARFCVLLVALTLLFRLALAVLLPTVLHKTARQFGFDLSYRRLDLNLIGTHASIWDLVLRPKDQPDVLLKNEYAFANISSLALFRLKLVAYRLEADGVRVNVVRRPDGSIPLVDQLRAATVSKKAASSDPLRFESPFTVEAVRLHHVELDVDDQSVTPPFRDRLTIDLRVSDLGVPGGPVRLEADLFSRSMLEALRVQGEAELRGDGMTAAVNFTMYGLRLKDAQAYLASLGAQSNDLSVGVAGTAELSLNTIAGKPGAVAGSAVVRDVRLSAGGEEAVRLDRAEVHLAELSPSTLHLGKVVAQGGLVRLRRTPEGLVTFASLSPGRAAGPGTAPTPTTAPIQSTAPATVATPTGAIAGPEPSPTTPATPFAWRLDELVASDLAGEFRDQVGSPERRFEARVSSFELKNVASAGAKEDAATLKLAMTLPEIASDVRIAGTAHPFADTAGATITFDAAGVRPEALRFYLTPLGIEPTLKAGRFHAILEATARDLAGASPRTAFKLSDVRLDDGDAGLLNLASVSVSGLKRDAATGAIEVAEVEASGPALTVRRIDENTLELPAFRCRRAVAAGASPVPAGPDHRSAATTRPATRPTPVPPPVPLPIVRVNKLTWGGANIRLEDLSTAGSEPVDLSDARLELSGFVLDLRPDAPPSQPGKVTGRFKSPGLADDVHLDGTLTPGAGSLAADLTFGGEGLNLRRLAPYLKPLGVEPRLGRGTLKFSTRASVAQNGETVTVAAEVRDAELSDGGTRLLALGRASVDGFQLSPAGFGLGDVTITKPYARVERDEDGGLIAGGLKLLPRAATQSTASASAQPAVVASTQPAATPPAVLAGAPGRSPARPVDPFEVLAQLPPVTLKSLALESAEVDWLDRAGPKPIGLKLAASATLESFALNQPQPRVAKYDLVVSSPGVADRVHVAGTLEPTPNSISFAANVDATGLRPEALAPYLPKGVEPAMKSGTFRVAAGATLSRLRDGGLAGALKVESLALRDGGAADAPPLAALDGVDVAVEQFNPATGNLKLARVAVTGVDASAIRDADGSISVLGLRLAAPPQAATAVPGDASGQQPAAPAVADVAPADLQAIVAQAQERMPLVTVESLDVRLKRISVEDRLRKAAPVALTDFRLSNDGPITLLGPNPQSNPPVKFNLSGTIDPAVKQFAVVVEAAPFAERPTAKVGIDATGIDGDGLTRVAPELAATFDGKPLADGRFKTLLEAEANVRRRGPTRIDLSRGLELSFSVTESALRQGENGPVLAGVGRVRGEQVNIGVHGGGVTVRSLEVNDLAANAWREQSGIYVLGMRVKGTEVKGKDEPTTPSRPPPEEGAANGAPPIRAENARVATAAAAGPEATPRPEVRIDRLAVSGLDFRFEDRALDPPVVIPITSLDADFRGLSSLALEKERPVRFNLSVGAGKVTLPKHVRGGALTGAIGDLAKLAGGKRVETAPETEERDFFAQLTAGGNLKLYPKPAGRALVSVDGVELAAIRGLAASSGVGLNAGTFDGRIELKTRDDEKLDVRSRLVMTDLSVSEPPNGPIVRFLNLHAPLDVVLAAIEAPDKSITLPLHFQVDGATPGGIGPAAVGAVSQVLLTAVASTPVKAVTGVVGLFGDTAKETEVVKEEPVYLELAAGVTSLDAAGEARLAAVLRRAKRDRNVRVVIEHELGTDDVALAGKRANPSAAQAKTLAENLLLRRRELLVRRDTLLAPARAAALAGSAGAAEVAEFRFVTAQLGAADDAMDRLYDFQKPGADRLADRRTRAAAIELADERLALIRTMVQAPHDQSLTERVRVGTSRFVSHSLGRSRLVISVARAVPKKK